MILSLVYPSKNHEKEAFEYIQEFIKYNSEINGTGGLDRYKHFDEWLLKLESDLEASNNMEGRVPANTYFCIRKLDSKIVGMVSIRHKLNEFLYNEGGHIGYSIRPTERKKGYATLMLKLALEKCKELKLDKVLITCDKINVASAKVILNNNGIFENEIYSKTCDEIIQRYWIELNKEEATELISMQGSKSLDSGPFYHGTKADLKLGDLLEPKHNSNYGERSKANFVYMSATLDTAIWGAELAVGDGPGRIYRVEPTGTFEDDPNLTDKKFPGNPTRSYRTRQPLRVVGEVLDWEGHSPEVLQKMLDHLAELKRLGIEAINE